MIRFVGAALILLMATTGFSPKVTSEERSQAGTNQRFEIENQKTMIDTESAFIGSKPIPNFSMSSEVLTFQRNARFYSWRGKCYTQDREENWYQVDARLC